MSVAMWDSIPRTSRAAVLDNHFLHSDLNCDKVIYFRLISQQLSISSTYNPKHSIEFKAWQKCYKVSPIYFAICGWLWNQRVLDKIQKLFSDMGFAALKSGVSGVKSNSIIGFMIVSTSLLYCFVINVAWIVEPFEIECIVSLRPTNITNSLN